MNAHTIRNREIWGGLAMLAGVTASSTMDAVVKIASADIPVTQVTWGRFVFHFLLLTPFVLARWRDNVTAIKDKSRWYWSLHLLRGLCLSLASLSFFLSVSNNPIPDALAVFFVEPFIVMIMAYYFLGEKLNSRRLMAAFFGLIGVCVILRPGGETDYHWSILFSLSAATFYAGFIVLVRFSSTHTGVAMTSWLAVAFGLIPLIILMFFFWQPVDSLRGWLLLIAVGFLSGLGHTLIILACHLLSASRIAVIHYAEVAVATLISWFLFGHFPDIWVWVGITLIVAANIYATFNKEAK